MYFKIEKSGCDVRKGLLQIRYDLFFNEKDKEYEDVFKIYGDGNFCTHFVFFKNVTDEEILFVGELALDMAYKNYLKGNLLLNKNLAFEYKPSLKTQNETRLSSVLATDFTKVKNAEVYSVK
jgi:hypothetical protein